MERRTDRCVPVTWYILTIGSGASSCAHITQGTVVLRLKAVSAAHLTYNSPPIP